MKIQIEGDLPRQKRECIIHFSDIDEVKIIRLLNYAQYNIYSCVPKLEGNGEDCIVIDERRKWGYEFYERMWVPFRIYRIEDLKDFLKIPKNIFPENDVVNNYFFDGWIREAIEKDFQVQDINNLKLNFNEIPSMYKEKWIHIALNKGIIRYSGERWIRLVAEERVYLSSKISEIEKKIIEINDFDSSKELLMDLHKCIIRVSQLK